MTDNDLILSVFRTARLHGRLFHSIMEDKGVDGGMHDGRILHMLSEEDGISQKELAGRMNIKPQSLTGTLEKLQEEGFIERHRSTVDKRELILSITPLGLEREKVLTEVRNDTARKLFTILDESEKRQLLDILDKVSQQDLDLLINK